uniref:Uncharacterized protein n=1 Tax=Cucumis melo TaxID=3656 RepID=A0A9I9E516_CUCME
MRYTTQHNLNWLKKTKSRDPKDSLKLINHIHSALNMETIIAESTVSRVFNVRELECQIRFPNPNSVITVANSHNQLKINMPSDCCIPSIVVLHDTKQSKLSVFKAKAPFSKSPALVSWCIREMNSLASNFSEKYSNFSANMHIKYVRTNDKGNQGRSSIDNTLLKLNIILIKRTEGAKLKELKMTLKSEQWPFQGLQLKPKEVYSEYQAMEHRHG